MRAWLQRFRERMAAALRSHLRPSDVGLGVGIGIFIGCLPIFGLHLPTCVLLARRLQLNQALVYGAANISNPLFAPFLVAAEISLGEWIRGVHATETPVEAVERPIWEFIAGAPDVLWSCVVGSVVIGAVLGVVLGGVAYGIAHWRVQRRDRA